MIEKYEDTVIVRLGMGDVLIHTAHEEGKSHPNTILFEDGDPSSKPGQKTDEFKGTTTKTHPCPVRLKFENKKGIGVLIGALAELLIAMPDEPER